LQLRCDAKELNSYCQKKSDFNYCFRVGDVNALKFNDKDFLKVILFTIKDIKISES
jgi:hypothetical protein